MSSFENRGLVHNQAGVQVIYGNVNSYDHVSFPDECFGPSVHGKPSDKNLSVRHISDLDIDDRK